MTEILSESALVVAPRGVKRRGQIAVACDFCRQRKVRCDGGSPCVFCLSRDVMCTYAEEPPAKRPKLELAATAVVSAPAFTLESSLVRGFTRVYYIDTYGAHVFKSCPMLGFSLIPTPEPGDVLEYSMAMCHSARALGHSDIADQLAEECRNMASQLIDHFTPGTAAGFFLMAIYQLGDNVNLTQHYFSIAHSLANGLQANERSERLRQFLRGSSLLRSAHRGFNGEHLEDVRPLDLVPVDANNELALLHLLGHPLMEEIVDRLRMFPVRSEFSDCFCRIRLLERYPVELRTNDLLSSEKISLFLESLRIPEDAVMHNLPEVSDENCLFLIGLHGGSRMMVCAFGGLITLGCKWALDIVSALEQYSTMVSVFNHNYICMTVLALANFFAIYRVHPNGPEHDYRSFMVRIMDILRPLQHFKHAAKIIAAIERYIRTADQTPAVIFPHPNELELSRDMLNNPGLSLTDAFQIVSRKASAPWPITFTSQQSTPSAPHFDTSTPRDSTPEDTSPWLGTSAESPPIFDEIIA